MAVSSAPLLNGLSEIAPRYDAAICDVWGVLHNGRDAFLPATEAMRRFRAERGPVVLLSNAPRLADGVEALFDRVGLKRDFYDAIVTGGEAAHADLLVRARGRTLPLYYLGPNRDHPLLDGLDVRLTDAAEAAAVLCTGFVDDETEAPDDYRALLQKFRARNLPFLCANPDLVVQRGDRLIYCAGAIAKLYESMGGEAVYYGKPYRPVFDMSLAKLRRFGAASRPLVIGDGVKTDILGANGVGWDALFIAGGVHGAELAERPEAVDEFLRQNGVKAAGAMAALSW